MRARTHLSDGARE